MLKGLFAQVYLHGFLLLLVVSVSAIAVSVLASYGEHRNNVERAGRYVVEQLAERWDDRARLVEELRRQNELFGVMAAIYDLDGVELANTGGFRAPALRAEERSSLLEDRQVVWLRPGTVVLPVERGDELIGYAMGRSFTDRDRRPLRALAVISTIALVLALASIPLVNRIVRPLRRIGATTHALGEGELGARTGVRRGDEIGVLARQVDEMAEKIERASRVERELLANVSHELRTPLARLRVALELAGEVQDERRSEVLVGALADVAEVDALTEDILMSARLERGGVRLDEDACDADAWIEGVVATARRTFPSRVIEIEGATLSTRTFDSKWLARAVGNLVENALKYSDDSVRVVKSLDDSHWRIAVSDSGIGISSEELERIFTPFYRVGVGEAGRRGGFGLGLTLARRVVTAHGGTLEVESEAGEGSTFTVQIPLH